MKTVILFLIITLSFKISTAQTTAIPDPNFEQALIDVGIDSGPIDGVVLTANVSLVSGLAIDNKNISDLTGIEDFSSITFILCRNNQLTSLNFSQNLLLKSIYAGFNSITTVNLTQNDSLELLNLNDNLINSIDVTQNYKLKELLLHNNININNIDVTQNLLLEILTIGNNNLSSIDVTQNSLLNNFWCSANQLTSIDVSQNPILIGLYCDANQITSVDVSQNLLLTDFHCQSNQIANIDVSMLDSLEDFNCGFNQLTNIDISNNLKLERFDCSLNLLTNIDVSVNTALTYLRCDQNQLTELNISANPNINVLYAQTNNLSCLNISNGNNQNFTTFVGIFNFGLNCIEVDDTAWSNANWSSNVDAGVSFSTNCSNNCSVTPCNTTANFNVLDNGLGNFTFTNTSAGNFSQTHWAFGDGTSSTTINNNHTFSANGTYVVVLTINDSTNSNLCFDYFLDTIIVTGVPSPAQCAAGFVMYPDTTTGDITVVNSSTGTSLTYLWDFGDGSTSTLQTPSHTYTTSGPFYLCLTVDDGVGCNNMYCDSIGSNGVVFKQAGFTINVIAPPLITGLTEEDTNSNFYLFPNPTSTQLTIEYGSRMINEITILDITGKTFRTIKKNINTIDVSDLSNGIYFVQINTVDGVTIRKWVKK
jgi:PKD repeat protein